MIKINTECERIQKLLRRKEEAENDIIELIYLLEILGYYNEYCGTAIDMH